MGSLRKPARHYGLTMASNGPARTARRPLWPVVVAMGFFLAALGAFVIALDLLFGNAPRSVGGGLLAIGAMVGFGGGYLYFTNYFRGPAHDGHQAAP